MRYKIFYKTPDVIFDTQTSKFIPMAIGNQDYEEYLKWLAEGNEPDVEQPPSE